MTHPWTDDLLHTLSRHLHSTSAWKDLAGMALADAEVARQHEGRFLVELLQNVRDAWCLRPGQGHAGSVVADRHATAALIVTEHGLLVADQGAGFDLSDSTVRDAVMRLGRSSKPTAGGDARDALGLAGHKGIGLKAILRRCQAFQVWSRVEADRGRAVAADFRRSRTMAALSGLLASAPSEVARLVAQEKALIPLFRFPHPMDVEGAPVEDRELAEALLAGTSGLPGLDGAFRTVVRLDFVDEEWNAVLDPSTRWSKDVVPVEMSPDAVWREVCEIDPRTVLLLGTIEYLHLLRLRDGEAIDQGSLHLEAISPVRNLGDAVQHRRFALHGSGVKGVVEDGGASTWDVFASPADAVVEGFDPDDEGFAEVCVALPRAPLDDLDVDQPLTMYYPIQAPGEERGDGLPFVVHGPFLVKPDRTGLDHGPVGRARNAQVLRAACRIATEAAVWLVGGGPDAEPDLRAPWCLCPTPSESDEPGLIGQFRDDLLDNLARSPVLRAARPGVEPVTPSETRLLVSADDRDALERSQRLAELFEDAAADEVPAPETLRSALTWTTEAWGGRTERCQPLLGRRLDGDLLVTALRKWAQDVPGQSVETTPARADALASAVLELLTGDEGGEVLDTLAQEALPILPCVAAIPSDAGAYRIRLVRASAPGGRTKSPRVVLYRRSAGDDDPEAGVETLQPPPEVPVHLLVEPRWSRFRDLGRSLGLREEGGDPTLVEEVLERARPERLPATAAQAESAGRVGGYLAALLHRIAQRAQRSGQEWLDHRPGGWIPDVRLWRDANSSNQSHLSTIRREAGRWRGRQLARTFPVPTAHGGWRTARETYLPDSWHNAAATALASGEVDPTTQRATTLRALQRSATHLGQLGTLTALAAPTDPRWVPWRRSVLSAVSDVDANTALARLLLFLGCWASPRVACRWQWPVIFTRTEDEPELGIYGDGARWDLAEERAAHELTGLHARLQTPDLAVWSQDIHYTNCTRGLATRHAYDRSGGRLVRQSWLPDVGTAGFPEAIEAALAAGWLQRSLTTRWTCRCNHRKNGRQHWLAPRALPTLASLQVSQGVQTDGRIGSDDVQAPLAAMHAPTNPTDEGSPRSRLRDYLPVWDGALAGVQVSASLVSSLRMPSRPEQLDFGRSATLLRWMRDHHGDRSTLSQMERGLLTLVLRRALEPVAQLLKRSRGEWDGAACAVLGEALRTAGALPCTSGEALVWVPLEPDDESPGGYRLAPHLGRPVAMLGSRRNLTRVDRERVRRRCCLLRTESPSDGPLPQLASLADALGVELVEGSADPPLTFAREVTRSAVPWRDLLTARRDLLLAWCTKDRPSETAAEAFVHGLERIRCVTGLAEDFEEGPRPIPTAWGRTRGDTDDQPGLFIDVEKVPDGAPCGDLAWGVSGLLESHDRLAGFMALLGAADQEALDAVARALGVEVDAAPPQLSGNARDRLAWLTALGQGGDVAGAATRLLETEGWPDDPEQARLSLPEGLRDVRIAWSGRLDAAALWALRTRLGGGATGDRLEAFLTASRMRFSPRRADLAQPPIPALRRLVAIGAWRAREDVQAVSEALGQLDDALASPVLTVGAALGGGLGPEPELGDLPLDALVWHTIADEDARLLQAAQALGPAPAAVGLLCSAPSKEARQRTVEEHRSRVRSRRDTCRRDRWEQAPLEGAQASLLAASALAPARRSADAAGGGGGGVSVTANERGEVGELVALRDVVLRVLRWYAERPDEAVTALRSAAEWAMSLRAASRRVEVPDEAALTNTLRKAEGGDTVALEQIAALVDVSAERGPGFDLVDPMGPLLGERGRHPARVEVKTTASPVPAGGSVVFRLTVNELFRSMSGDQPYVVRVYHDPGAEHLPRLEAEIRDPVSLVPGLEGTRSREVLSMVRGGGHVILTAHLADPAAT